MSMMQQFKSMLLFDKRKDEQDIFLQIKDSFTKNGKLVFAGQLLKLAYEKFENRTALILQDKSITYKEFYFRAVQLSHKIKNLGINPKDRVLLFFENSMEFYIAYFAIWQIGAVVVPLNIFLHEKELAYIVNDSNPSLAIVSDGLKKNWDELFNLNLVQNLPSVLTQEDIDWKTPVPEKVEDVYPDFKIDELGLDELCVLLYTSGTTGLPKGVMLSSRNVLINAMQEHTRLMICNQQKKERFFSVLPLFHVFAQNTCLWLPVMIGGSVIIVSKIDRKLILEGLRKKPTIFFGFPALYGLLCLLKTAPLDSIRLFVSGADMLPDKIRSAFAMIYGRKICAGYGLTEASPTVAFNQQNDWLQTDVVGHPFFGIECDIRDESEKSLQANQIGSLWLRGDNIMLGYYKAEQATSKVLKNGWLNTGDLAAIDKKGNLAIRGRNKDLIIHKGFNIYPQEVENVLMSHPSVVKAAVIGKEESLCGQIPVAFVAVKSDDLNLEKSLRELCANNLAAYKIPRKIVCLDDLPMSATGKIDKKQLQLF